MNGSNISQTETEFEKNKVSKQMRFIHFFIYVMSYNDIMIWNGNVF